MIGGSHHELALLLITPTLVNCNDFVFVLEDLVRSKFNICALQRAKLEKEDVAALFTSDISPRLYNAEVLAAHELSKGKLELTSVIVIIPLNFSIGSSVLVVLEKEKAVNDLSELIGRFEIKTPADFEKTKRKQSSSGFYPFQASTQSSLIHDFGSYLFCFPN